MKYGLNESYIYPELPSFANYLKEKYTESNFRIDNCYSIVEDNDINFAHIKEKYNYLVRKETNQGSNRKDCYRSNR